MLAVAAQLKNTVIKMKSSLKTKSCNKMKVKDGKWRLYIHVDLKLVTFLKLLYMENLYDAFSTRKMFLCLKSVSKQFEPHGL